MGPAPTNRAAIRAVEQAGFTYLKTVRAPGEVAPEYLMSVMRADGRESTGRA